MTPRRCLSIATSDSSAGAGIQADLKAFAAAGVYGMTVLVGLTAQNTRGVISIHELPSAFIEAQLEAVFDDIDVDAVKTGALLSRSVIETVAGFLERHPRILVVDPVLRSSSGAALLDAEAVDVLLDRLLPLATVVTPNLDEARALAGGAAARSVLGKRLLECGARAVLITGGQGAERSDCLCTADGVVEIPITWVESTATHGTGCTHSATLVAELAKGTPLLEAAQIAASVTAGAIRHGIAGLGAGPGPVDVLQSSASASHRLRTT